MILIGVDYGLARIGLAKSDDERRLAFPFGVVRRGKSDEEGVAALIRALEGVEVARFIVGDPIRLDGTGGEASRRARAFAALLEARSGIPITLVDERLTTSAAAKSLRELGVDSRGQKDIIDASAAALLLQSHLDASRESPWESELDPYDPQDQQDQEDQQDPQNQHDLGPAKPQRGAPRSSARRRLNDRRRRSGR